MPKLPGQSRPLSSQRNSPRSQSAPSARLGGRPRRLPMWVMVVAVAIASAGVGAILAVPFSAKLLDWALRKPLAAPEPQFAAIADWAANEIEIVPEPAPWPEIHDRARLAKVPVLMYHDILPEKEVFFDVTPAELEEHFRLLQAEGVTPVSMDGVVQHLRAGVPLPEKPVLLTFDDGYGGHYEYVYPLLKRYGYPAVFSVYVDKMGQTTGRSAVTWEQLQELADDPLVEIASHSVSHPQDLRAMSDAELQTEVVESKRILEDRLGIEIDYFTYPVGKNDERVREVVAEAGYRAALAMDDYAEDYANTSGDLLQVMRFGQSRIEEVIEEAWGGYPLPVAAGEFNFSSPVTREDLTASNGVRVTLLTGGRPTTIHADSRYQVEEIVEGTDAIAAVDGGFFSLKDLKANTMIGPALSAESQNAVSFVPGNPGEIPLIDGRPLVLISRNKVEFVPFDHAIHNTQAGIEEELPEVTDAFVAAAWLVKESAPRSRSSFKDLYGFDAIRFRAFWGINQAGQPVVGATQSRTDSVTLSNALLELGLRDAVMLDSGASTSLVHEGQSLVGYTPRPVPHVVALFPPEVDPDTIMK